MNKVQAYLFVDMDRLPKSFAEQNLCRLPVSRQERCAQYRRQTDRNACVLAYMLLYKGLSEQFGIAQPPEFIFNEYGKPYLRDTPQIYFNFSHCKLGVICVLADFEIGVDIQDIQPFDMGVAQRVCSNDELRQLSESDNPSKLFCRIWTKKESYAKAHGISIADVLRADNFPNRFLYRESEDYYISICCRRHKAHPAEIMWNECENVASLI